MKVTAAALLEALTPGCPFDSVNAGTYPGTNIAVRRVSPDHELTIDARGHLDDHDGGWIVERFCGQGSRSVGRRVALRLGA